MDTSTYGNGVVTSHTYNDDNTLALIAHSGTGTSIGDYSYTWDANKNKLSETITGVMSGYGFDNTAYDTEDRLTGWNRDDSNLDQSWNLSPVGDWNSISENGDVQTRTHGPTHELLTADSQSVTHDAKGNMTLIPTALRPDSNALSLVWDQDNKMSSATTNGVTVTQRFDALGRRVARNNDIYVQAGQQTVADYVSGTTPATPEYTYVYASYIDEPVMRAGSGGVRYYHRGQQYSVTALTDSAGRISERYAYTAYGKLSVFDINGISQAVGVENNRYTYTGREWDEAMDFYHFRARVFCPHAARFLSVDPAEFKDGPSLYSGYFGLSQMDPSGMVRVIGDPMLACVHRCEDDCARLYPRWYQLHRYTGCVAGCRPGCNGEDFSLCSYIRNTMTDNYKNAVSCICTVVDIADVVVPSSTPAGPVVGGLDCACEVLTNLINRCEAPNAPGFDGIAFLQATDCILDLYGVAGIPFIPDLLDSLINAVIYGYDWGNEDILCGHEACSDVDFGAII